MTAPLQVRWLWAFLDTPAPDAAGSWEHWSSLTRSTLSPVRGVDGEFATLLPEAGDPWVKVQAIGSGAGGIHLDLDVDNPQDAAATALALGASLVADRGYVVLRSPGGLTFCLTSWHGEHDQVRVGERDLLDQVCIDVPSERYAAETAFWSALTGWEWVQSDVPEFSYCARPAAMPLRLLFQRLGEPQGEVRAHVDFACVDRRATERAHEELGSVVVDRRDFWTVLRDPVGRVYCLTDRTPTQEWRA